MLIKFLKLKRRLENLSCKIHFHYLDIFNMLTSFLRTHFLHLANCKRGFILDKICPKMGISCQNYIINENTCMRETQISQFYRYAKTSQLLKAGQFCRYVGDTQCFGIARNLWYVAEIKGSPNVSPQSLWRRLYEGFY